MTTCKKRTCPVAARRETTSSGAIWTLIVIWFMVTSAANAADRPNIVFMLSDDQGWNGLSVAMHPSIAASKGEIFHTPNLEKLASQGMRFSAAYAPAPVCSPTRISIQTGKSPAQLHWTKAAPAVPGRKLLEPRLIKDLNKSEITIGELLKKAGYATAHYGKWHIGGGGPGAHGYDEHDGDTGNENAFKFTDPNPVDIFGMAERAAKFMETCQQNERPFYIQLSWNALHAPELAMKATQAKYEKFASSTNPRQLALAAITEDLDSGVGKVLEAIDRLGLTDNTYVIYMSDNGAGGSSKRGGLSGGKGSGLGRWHSRSADCSRTSRGRELMVRCTGGRLRSSTYLLRTRWIVGQRSAQDDGRRKPGEFAEQRRRWNSQTNSRRTGFPLSPLPK